MLLLKKETVGIGEESEIKTAISNKGAKFKIFYGQTLFPKSHV
jgi:hypothetical protein